MTKKPPIDAEAKGQRLADIKPAPGRPREHASPAARQKAWLERNGLVRTSVTVPAGKVEQLREFARKLTRGQV
jgi:hypothetical protein